MSRENGPWYVYDLIDPRDMRVFYIGCTINPGNRYKTHLTDWGSSAKRQCLGIRAAGMHPGMVIVSRHLSAEAARAAESVRIRSMPWTFNASRHIWDQMTDEQRDRTAKVRAKK